MGSRIPDGVTLNSGIPEAKKKKKKYKDSLIQLIK